MKIVEKPPQEFLDAVSKEYGRLKARVVDLEFPGALPPPTPSHGHGYAIVVAIKEGEGIAVVKDEGNPQGLFSFPMGPLSEEDLAAAIRRIGRVELGMEVRLYKVPALHVARFHFRDGEKETWNFVAVGAVEGPATQGREESREVRFVADPMSLPGWKQSDWHYWILRDAEIHH